MIYTPRNTGQGATVHVAGRGKLAYVVEVDTDKGDVTSVAQPLQVNQAGDSFITETQRFSVVFPLFGGFKAPIAFVCIP
jgi:type IV secretory pathway TrbF-like protein